MRISGIQQYTMLDYPGKLACVVFTPGCTMRCPFCHNPENVLPERIQELSSDFVSEDAFFSFLQERKGLLEGVSICGGEPTIHRDLPAFAARIKKKGFSVKVDTNGSNFLMIAKMIEEGSIDYIAVDIKHTPDTYSTASGSIVGDHFRRNFKSLLNVLKTNVVEYEYRTTVIKGMHTEDDIRAIGSYVAGVKNYYLQTFRSGTTLDPYFAGCSYTEEEMHTFQEIAAPFVEQCEIRV